MGAAKTQIPMMRNIIPETKDNHHWFTECLKLFSKIKMFR